MFSNVVFIKNEFHTLWFPQISIIYFNVTEISQGDVIVIPLGIAGKTKWQKLTAFLSLLSLFWSSYFSP